MRELNRIIVHCSATTPEQDIGVEEIRKWHIDRGWSDVGYHFVICRDGGVEQGRPIERAGAHAKGWNKDSVGICLVGGVVKNDDHTLRPDANFTLEQYNSLGGLVEMLLDTYGEMEIMGHREVPGAHKDCPCFDVRSLLEIFTKA